MRESQVLICSHDSMQWTEYLCYMYEFFVETTPQLFHNASIWLTLVLAVQRYIYICQATRARHLCTIPRARKIVVGVIVTAFLHMSPRMFDRTYRIEQGQWVYCGLLSSLHVCIEGMSDQICVVQFASWINSISHRVYLALFFGSVEFPFICLTILVLFRLRLFLVHLLPCLLLLIFNGLLLAGVLQAEKKRSNLVVARARRRGRSATRTNQTFSYCAL